MTEISYTTAKGSGKIYWAAAEQFKELFNKKFDLGKMEAGKIEKLKDLSPTAKILLSAVSGAIIQHLIDEGVEIDLIFSSGSFNVEKQARTLTG